MRIPLDGASDVPLFRQIERWMRVAIANGGLPTGTKLPSTRALAAELGVSRITVTTAYAELEAAGLLRGQPGSGSYVATTAPATPLGAAAPGTDWPLWQLDAAGGSAEPGAPPAVPSAPHDGMISFTGVMDPRQFPIGDVARTVREVLRVDGAEAADYGPFDGGHAPLRQTIAELLASQGIQTDAERVLITSGSQQALALLCGVLLRPGDAVLVEQPTYDHALELFGELELRIIGIPMDDDGMQLDLVEPAMQQHHPRAVYTIPNFQNPTGACLSGDRRRRLLELSARYNVPIVEDDFAGDLRYDGRSLPAIKALDVNGQVIYLGTFSKLLMPGLRVGYLVADGPILQRLARRKRVHDLTTSPLLQRVLDRYVTVGRYQAHLRRATRRCRARRDTLMTAVRTYLPDVAVTPPRGGLFAWLELPPRHSAGELLAAARAQGVTFAPGTRFFPEPGDGDGFLRLNFATCTPEEIDLGVRRIADAIAG